MRLGTSFRTQLEATLLGGRRPLDGMGRRLEVHGCDLWTFRDGKVVRKDSFWKIRTPPT